MYRAPALFLVAGITGCTSQLSADNPYDPDAPPELQEKASLVGVVLGGPGDGSGPTPLEGATVTLTGAVLPADPSVTTGTDGSFGFDNLTPETYGLEVSHPAHINYAGIIGLVAAEQLEVEVILQALPQGIDDDTGRVTGQVFKDAEQLRPDDEEDHSGVLVEVIGTGIRTVSNALGEFDLFLVGGNYDLQLSATDYLPLGPIAITVVPGDTVTVPGSPLVLPSNPGQVVGTVLLEGAPADGNAGVDVALLTSESDQTDANGDYLISGVLAGTYILAASKDLHDTETLVGITVRGGSVTNVPTITLMRSRGRIVGQVALTGSGVTDFSGVNVSLVNTAFGATSSTSGEFAIEGVPTGTYDLVASRDQYSSITVGAITLDANETVNVGLLTLAKQQGAFQIDGGLDFTNQVDGDVTLTLSAPPESIEIEIVGDLDPTESVDWRSFDSAVPVVVRLSNGDGSKSLTVTFRDAALVESPPFSDSIVLDRQEPETIAGINAVSINGGASFANNSTGLVTVGLNITDSLSGVSHFRISNDGNFDLTPPGEEWRPFVGATTHILLDPATQGPKTTYVEFRDFAGNVRVADADTTTVVTLDYEPPAITTADVDCPSVVTAGQCNERTVFISITATDNFDPSGNGATWIALANEEGFIVEDFRPFLPVQSWQLSPGDGAKTIHIKLRDAAGNRTNQITRTLDLDTAAPTSPTVSIDEGNVVRAPGVNLSLTCTGADQAKVDVINPAGTRASGAWVPMAASLPATLAGTDGNYRVEAFFRDAAGNQVASPGIATTILDTIDPSGESVVIDSGASRTDTTVVTLNLTGTDAGGSGITGVKLAYRQTDLDAAIPVPYQPAMVWALEAPSGPNVEETKAVWMRLVDMAGNESGDATDDIVFDTLAPTGTIAVSPSPTADSRAQLSLSYSADTELMKLSDGGACAGGNWVAVAGSTVWNLPAGDGGFDISVRFRDGVGNESGCETANVVVDTTGPDPDTFTLTGNGVDPAYSNSLTVSLNVSSADSDCDRLELAEDVGFVAITGGAATCSLNGTYDLAMTEDGARSLFVRFIDTLGNVGPLAQASIILDRTPPIVALAGITIAEAPWTNQTTIHIGNAVSGADQISITEGACTGGWLTYVPTMPYSFEAPASDGDKVITVAYRDLAGNPGEDSGSNTCFSATVSLDTEDPTLTATVEGLEMPLVIGRTAGQLVKVKLAGLSGGTNEEVIVANRPDLSDGAWQPMPPADELDWILTPGDGAKTLQVQVRDLAGNTSPKRNPAITLDQTAPPVPDLQIADNDGDGFAIDETLVELAWTDAGDPNLDRYELERFVQGIDPGFGLLQSFAPGTDQHVDDVDATTGRIHNYRVRAVDDLGNTSAYSVTVSAAPFRHLETVWWTKHLNGYRYDFEPQTGTFGMRTDRTYENYDQDDLLDQLPFNVPSWDRPTAIGQAFGEVLNIEVANQDNSLVLKSRFDLGLGGHQVVDIQGSVGDETSVALDANGALHVAYQSLGPPSDLRYATNASGDWVVEVPDSGGVGRYSSIAVDSAGAAHIAYWDSDNYDPKYTTNATGAWVAVTLETGNLAGEYMSMDLDSNDKAHVCYTHWSPNRIRYATNASGSWSATSIAGSTSTLAETDLDVDDSDKVHVVFYDAAVGLARYATNATGSWVDEDVGIISPGAGRYPSIAVDSNGYVHVSASDSVKVDLIYLKRNPISGTWMGLQIIDGDDDSMDWAGSFSDLKIDSTGNIHVIYQHTSDDTLSYATFSDAFPWWQTFALGPNQSAANHSGLAVDQRGRPHVCYKKPSVDDVHCLWTEPVGLAAEPVAIGRSPAIAADASGVMHIAFDDTGSNTLAYATFIAGVWVVETADATAGVGQYPDLVLDAAGHAHISYYDQGAGRLRYATNQSGGWDTEVVDGSGLIDVGLDTAIAMSSSGDRHISYYDATNQDLKYAFKSGAAWQVEAVDQTGEVGRYSDIAVDATGTPHLVYLDITDQVLTYATGGTGAWSFSTVVSYGAPTAVAHTSLALRGGTVPHVAHPNPGTGQLQLSWYAAGEWQTMAVDDDCSNPILTFDQQGNGHIISERSLGMFAPQVVRYTTDRSGVWVGHTLTMPIFMSAFTMAIDPGGVPRAACDYLGQVFYLGSFVGKLEAPNGDRTTTF